MSRVSSASTTRSSLITSKAHFSRVASVSNQASRKNEVNNFLKEKNLGFISGKKLQILNITQVLKFKCNSKKNTSPNYPNFKMLKLLTILDKLINFFVVV